VNISRRSFLAGSGASLLATTTVAATVHALVVPADDPHVIFINQLMQKIAGSLEVSFAELARSVEQANYSSSRLAMKLQMSQEYGKIRVPIVNGAMYFPADLHMKNGQGFTVEYGAGDNYATLTRSV
jgi:hypothetical protein